MASGRGKTAMADADKRQRFSDAVAALAPAEGANDTRLADVVAIRDNRPSGRRPAFYNSGIALLAQGRKRAFLAGRTYECSPESYVVLACPLPIEIEHLDVSPARPGLCLFVKVDIPLLGQLAHELAQQGVVMPPAVEERPQSVYATPLDEHTFDTAMRLAESLLDPIDTAILSSDIRRELVYRVLLGPQACALRALLGRNSAAARIGRILHDLHTAPERPVSVDAMARSAGMSVSAFHAAFKATTSMTPLQYLKAVRLHRAHTLLAFDGRRVAEAARKVGYVSASQFSRDYRRLFGMPPSAIARPAAAEPLRE